MTVQKWTTPEASFNVISGASPFTSLGSTARFASSATVGSQITAGVIPNATDGYTHIGVEIALVHNTAIFAGTPVIGAHFAVYAIPNISGTPTDGSSSIAPTSDMMIGSIGVRSAAATSIRVSGYNFEIPPFDFTLLIQNNTGVNLSGITWTSQAVNVRRYGVQGV